MRVDLVAELVGPGARVDAETSGDGGARTWWVTTASGAPLVLKVADASGPALLRSARAQERAASLGVPVPRVVGAGVRGDRQHLVMERVEGRPWHEVAPTLDPADRAGVLDELAEVLVRLRGASSPAFGDLADDATSPRAPARSELAAIRARTRARVADPTRAALADAVLTAHASAFRGTAAVLVHGDLHHANVLVRPGRRGWRLAAVLDWDSAWAGPPDADTARAALWDHMPGDPEPVGVRAAVQQVLWCLEHEGSTPRHRADTARLLHHLGVGAAG